jgi:hypothetical protein
MLQQGDILNDDPSTSSSQNSVSGTALSGISL